MSKKAINTNEVLEKAISQIEEDRGLIKNKIKDLGEQWHMEKTSASAMTDLIERLLRGSEQLIKIASVVTKAEPEKVQKTSVFDLLEKAGDDEEKDNSKDIN